MGENAAAHVEQAERLIIEPGGQMKALAEAQVAMKLLEADAPEAEGGELTEDQKLVQRARMVAGNANLRLGRDQEAAKHFKRVTELEPDHFAGQCGYAKSLFGQDNGDTAKAVLAKLEKAFPQSNTPVEMDMLGSAWLASDDRDNATKFLKASWARGVNPYEYALAFVDHYSNGRDESTPVDQTEGFADAVKFLKECGRGGGNKQDPRYRFQLAMMYEEGHFHRLFYDNTKPENTAADLAKQTAELKLDNGTQKPADPMLALPTTVKTDSTERDAYWSLEKLQEMVDEKCAEIVKADKSTLSPGNKQLAALQQLVREEKDAKNIHDLNSLYLYKTRQLVHCGEISTGKHLNPEKSFLEALHEWEELNREHPNMPEVMLRLVRQKNYTGKLEESLSLAKSALALDQSAMNFVSLVYNAVLAYPLEMTSAQECSAAMNTPEIIAAMIKCTKIMEERGGGVCDYELWDLYSDEMCHVTNTQLVLGATIIMRGCNKAEKFESTVEIGLPISTLIQEAFEVLGKTSIIAMELRSLYGYLAYELLEALTAVNKKKQESDPNDVSSAKEAYEVYEKVFSQLEKDFMFLNNPASVFPRLLAVARIAVQFAPKCYKCYMNLANMLFTGVDQGYLGSDSLPEAEKLLRTAIELEGKPMWNAPPPVAPKSVDEKRPGTDGAVGKAAAPRRASMTALPSDPSGGNPSDPSIANAVRRVSMMNTLTKTIATPAQRQRSVSMMIPSGSLPQAESPTASPMPAKERRVSEVAKEKEDEVVATNPMGDEARMLLIRVLKATGADKDAAMLKEVQSLSDTVLSVNPRTFSAWEDLAQAQFISSNALDAAKVLIEFPKPEKEDTLDKVDGQVHAKIVEFITRQDDPERCLSKEERFKHPQLAHSLIMVARSPLGWAAIEPTMVMLTDNEQKDLCKQVYEAAMKGKGADAYEMEKYMKSRRWMAKFGAVQSVFTEGMPSLPTAFGTST